MIDQAFVKKKMKKIMSNYTQDPSIQFTDEEIEKLLAEFNRRIQNEDEENINFILHDLIYEYLTTNYFAR